MTPLERAISICGTQTELARRIGGKIATGHVYYWLKHRVPEDMCPAIERATAGQVTVKDLRPDREWTKHSDGSYSCRQRFAPPDAEAA